MGPSKNAGRPFTFSLGVSTRLSLGSRWLLVVLVLSTACAKQHDRDPDAAVAGSGGVGGVGGTGGTGGTGGAGGVGGSGGAGGVGGGGGGGGVGGSEGRECESAEDCTLGGACCDCWAEPVTAVGRPVCLSICDQTHCEAIGVEAPACVAGRCVLDISCNQNEAQCDAPTPQCPVNQTPTVRNGCYGPCIDAIDCNEVTGCDNCGADQTCVSYVTAFGLRHHCVETNASCNGAPSCECMGDSACVRPFGLCSDTVDGLSCDCPTC